MAGIAGPPSDADLNGKKHHDSEAILLPPRPNAAEELPFQINFIF
jgi:hypothetical protein